MGEEIDETIILTEEIDNCVFELMVKRLSTAKDESTQQRRNPDWIDTLQQTNTKLPNLEMPTFKGDVLRLPSHWELFDTNIISLTTLTSVHKFSYLKTTREGEPSTLIANLELTAANYNSALEILKDRDGDNHHIIEAQNRILPNLDSKIHTWTPIPNLEEKRIQRYLHSTSGKQAIRGSEKMFSQRSQKDNMYTR